MRKRTRRVLGHNECGYCGKRIPWGPLVGRKDKRHCDARCQNKAWTREFRPRVKEFKRLTKGETK